MSANPAVIAIHSRRVTPAMVHALHAAQDDMGAWAETRSEKDANEWLSRPLGCRGLSCEQGRKSCRDGCNPFKEMSVYGDDENDVRAQAEWDGLIFVGLVLVVALMLIGAVMWLANHYAEPILAALGRVLN